MAAKRATKSASASPVGQQVRYRGYAYEVTYECADGSLVIAQEPVGPRAGTHILRVPAVHVESV